MSKPEEWTNWDDALLRLLAIVISPFIFGPFIFYMLEEQGMNTGDAFLIALPTSLPIGYLPFFIFDMKRKARRAAADRKAMEDRRAKDADLAAAIAQEAAKWHTSHSTQEDRKVSTQFVDDLAQMRRKIKQEKDMAAVAEKQRQQETDMAANAEKRRQNAQQLHFRNVERAFERLRTDVVYHAIQTLLAADNPGSLRVYSGNITYGDSTFQGPLCHGWKLFDGLILTTEAPNLRYGRYITRDMNHYWNRLPDDSLDQNEILVVENNIVTPNFDHSSDTCGLIYTLPGKKLSLSDREDEHEWRNSGIPELCWRMEVSVDPETYYYTVKPIRYHILKLVASLSNLP